MLKESTINFYARTTMLCVSVSVCALTIGCGGGGGSENNSTANNLEYEETGESAPETGLSGYIYYLDYDHEVMRYDLATQQAKRTIYHNFNIPDTLMVSDDSSLYVVTDQDTAHVIDTDSNLIHQFSMNYDDIVGPAILSPDNKLVLFYRSRFGDDDLLEIHDFNSIVYRLVGGASAWDWLDIREIIYVSGRGIASQNLSSTGHAAEQSKWLIEDLGGPIWAISLSPDKSKIAYVKSGLGVYIVDIDTKESYQIAQVVSHEQYYFDRLKYIEWSPDGNYLAISARGDGNSEYCSSVIVVPVKVLETIDLGLNNISPAIRLSTSKSDGEYYLCNTRANTFSWRSR